jgi:GntR family transcriptional regulator
VLDEAEKPSSRHAAIAAALRSRIESGALQPGAAIASEADLSAEFAVSRGTVRQALAALRGEGLITGGRGRRPVVARPTLAQSFDEMISFSAWAESIGRVPGARTLELVRRPADALESAGLDLEPDTPVFQYRRLRLLDGEPALIEVCTFIEPVGRLLLDIDMDHGSVYAQLGARGVVFYEAEQTIAAIAANAEQTALLGVGRRAPLLRVNRRVLGPDGRPLELSHDTYRGDDFAITVHNRVALARAGVGLSLVS